MTHMFRETELFLSTDADLLLNTASSRPNAEHGALVSSKCLDLNMIGPVLG
jgi:hypothetical protein